MNVKWFQNPDNIVYVNAEEWIPQFSKEVGVTDLREQIEEFRGAPTREGKTVKGKKRTSFKLLVPDLTFDEHLEMGENVWVYLGENYECYSLFWPWEEGK